MCAQLETDTNTLHLVLHQAHRETYGERDFGQAELFALTST